MLARRGEDEKSSALAGQAEGYVPRRLLHLPALLLMAQGRLVDARAALEEIAAGRGKLNPAVNANLLEVRVRAGNPRPAPESAHQVLALATRAGAQREIAQTHRALGVVLGAAGDRSTAADHFAEALRRYRALETRREMAQTLRDWAAAELESADAASRDRAREMLGEALALFREIGDRRGAEDALTALR